MPFFNLNNVFYILFTLLKNKAFLQSVFYKQQNTKMFKIQQVIQLIMDIDVQVMENLNYSTIRSMKKLFYIISQSVPFQLNVQTLAAKMENSRNTILKTLDIFERAGVINLLKSGVSGDNYLQKPEKIFLENPNFIYTLAETTPNIGNLRETFFFNQLRVNYSVNAPKYGDFFVDNQYVFEIGGATKTNKQIYGVPQA